MMMEREEALQLATKLKNQLAEEAMIDLTSRLIAVPSENPPGHCYDECARLLQEKLVRLRFDDVRREGACVCTDHRKGLLGAAIMTRNRRCSIHGLCVQSLPSGSRSQTEIGAYPARIGVLKVKGVPDL